MIDAGPVQREFGFFSSWVTWGARAAILALVAYAFFAGAGGAPGGAAGGLGAPAATPTGIGVWMVVGYLAALVALALVADLPSTSRPALLKWGETAVLTVVFLDALGGLLGWYRQFAQYDHVVHFVAGLLFVLVVYALAAGLGWSSLWRYGTRVETFVHAFAVVVMLGVFWEFFEAAMDLLNYSNPVRHFFGSTFDLLADAAGALVGAAIAAFAASEPEGSEEAVRRPGGAQPD